MLAALVALMALAVTATFLYLLYFRASRTTPEHFDVGGDGLGPAAYMVDARVASDALPLVDESGAPMTDEHKRTNERVEQYCAERYIRPDAAVLELGGRYGVVSVCINARLADPRNHVVVEPDPRVWGALEVNRAIAGSQFQIVRGIIADPGSSPQRLVDGGYGSYVVPSGPAEDAVATWTLADAEQLLAGGREKFDTLVVDCEGCFRAFRESHPGMFTALHTVILEDDRSDDATQRANEAFLSSQGLTRVFAHQIWSVWARQDS